MIFLLSIWSCETYLDKIYGYNFEVLSTRPLLFTNFGYKPSSLVVIIDIYFPRLIFEPNNSDSFWLIGIMT